MYAYAKEELTHLRERLAWTHQRIDPQFHTPNQVLGVKRVIGCVALEVTQRCNLDCSICYLSENSESTPDIPLETIFARIDDLVASYGVGTNVQITGGDPTLRDHDELEQIVAYVVSKKLVPALFTNGIHASRELLRRLKAVGLNDVAFHVDLTEKRKGYSSEKQLHEVRQEYIERVRGLGLYVIFNQTIFARNVDEVPDLIDFYKRNADVVSMASFQLQADTGRGLTRKRKQGITLDTVTTTINEAMGADLCWDNVQFGHPKCHRLGYAAIFGRGQKVVPLLPDLDEFVDLIHTFDDVVVDRARPRRAAIQMVTEATKRGYLPRGLKYWGGRLARQWKPLLKARGDVRKLTVVVQNFQDAQHIDHERIDNCSFHVMTDDGGISICVHNAYRDHYLQGGVGYPAEYQAQRVADGFPALTPGMEESCGSACAK